MTRSFEKSDVELDNEKIFVKNIELREEAIKVFTRNNFETKNIITMKIFSVWITNNLK
jgi:hypothetical protein